MMKFVWRTCHFIVAEGIPSNRWQRHGYWLELFCSFARLCLCNILFFSRATQNEYTQLICAILETCLEVVILSSILNPFVSEPVKPSIRINWINIFCAYEMWYRRKFLESIMWLQLHYTQMLLKKNRFTTQTIEFHIEFLSMFLDCMLGSFLDMSWWGIPREHRFGNTTSNEKFLMNI